MNIRFAFLITALTSFSYALPADYTGKQNIILLMKSLEGSPWSSTAPAFDIDPLFTLKHSTLAHPGLPGFAALFCKRTPHIAPLNHFVDAAAFEESVLHPFVKYAQHMTVQEHVAGVHLGQTWSQDGVEIGWQWWVGARERNLWLPYATWNEAGNTLTTVTRSASPQPLSNRTERPEKNHRLTYGHATHTALGIGDVHLHMRYRIPLHRLVFCSVGGYATVPVGARAPRITPLEESDILPANGNELAMKLINRAREVMLCAPLASNGHLGLGGTLCAGLALSPRISLKGEWTQVHYRSGTESRFALTDIMPLASLEEGAPGTLEGISGDNDISAHLRQTLYPTEVKVHVQPGMVRVISMGLHYEGMPFYGSIGYNREQIAGEYSETAPLMTLTLQDRENHNLIGTLGWRSRREWGELSWYASSTYTLKGSSLGAWSLAAGFTVQG